MALKKRRRKMSSQEIVFMVRRAKSKKLPLTLVARRGRGRKVLIKFLSISIVSEYIIRGYDLNRQEVVAIKVKDVNYSNGSFR
jgi:hypothetical protein